MNKQEFLCPWCGSLLVKDMPDNQVIMLAGKKSDKGSLFYGAKEEPSNYDIKVWFKIKHKDPNGYDCEQGFYLYIQNLNINSNRTTENTDLSVEI